MRPVLSMFFGVAVWLSLCAGSPAVVAAPQVLALIPTDGIVPLLCDDRTCSARVSTFYPQRWRPSPEAGMRYAATGGQGLRLMGVEQDGGFRDLSDDLELSIIVTFGSSAVEIEVPQTVLAQNGLEEIALHVGDGVSLVPVGIPGDPNPQSAQDIALVTGPLRDAADVNLKASGESVAVASLVNRTIGMLPTPYSRRQQPDIDVRSELFEVLPAMGAESGIRSRMKDILIAAT